MQTQKSIQATFSVHYVIIIIVLVVSKFTEVVNEINLSKRRIEEIIEDVWEKNVRAGNDFSWVKIR